LVVTFSPFVIFNFKRQFCLILSIQVWNLYLHSSFVFLSGFYECGQWYGLFGCSLHARVHVMWFHSRAFIHCKGSTFLGDIISLLDLNTIRVKTPLVVRLSPLVLINFKPYLSIILSTQVGNLYLHSSVVFLGGISGFG
jgi:hypothetical protein